MQVLGQIRRSFNSVSTDMLYVLYKTYVRPHLEYCVQAWCPDLAKGIDLIEKVYRHARKLLPFLSHQPYESHLTTLDLFIFSVLPMPER